MVILATGLKAAKGTDQLAELLHLELDDYGFIKSGHDLLNPTTTTIDGIYFAGCAKNPCNLATAISQAHASIGELSSKLIPGKKSYSLGNLCSSLGIKINGRHRAAGDALATVKLFDILLEINDEEIISNPKLSGNYLAQIHPNLDPQKVKSLPEIPGVYYFYNSNDELIYIGKSKNIHSRIIQHFGNNTSKKAIEMRQ